LFAFIGTFSRSVRRRCDTIRPAADTVRLNRMIRAEVAVDNSTIEALLTEIRDQQRATLDEYRRIAGEALALQKHAVEQQSIAVAAQARHLRLYRRVLMVTAPIVAGLLVLLWLLLRLR
jgi:urate oxidase